MKTRLLPGSQIKRTGRAGRVAVCVLTCMMGWGVRSAVAISPPLEPEIPPVVSRPTDVDKDGSGIDDGLERARAGAQATLSLATASAQDRDAARRALAQPVEIELVFDRQITQAQLDAFLKAGGTIDHVFTHVSYGWTGHIALEKSAALPALMGTSLLGVVGKQGIRKHMDEAARCGRVRPVVWNAGYDGDSVGADKITIAIIDDGVDDSHTDLTGRMEYWKDWTTDNHPTPQDLDHHGTHVAGIALGTGAASGVSPTTVQFTDFGTFASSTGFFSPSPIHIPTSVTSVNWTSTMTWIPGGGVSAEVGHLYFDAAGSAFLVSAATSGSTSPLTKTDTGRANPPPGGTNRWSPYASKAAGAGTPRYAVANTVSYAGVGDGFATFRGVAPDSPWAGLKVFTDSGSGSSLDFDEALDDIVAQRVTHNIRVANMSLGIVGSPGVSTSTRNKANAAAQNGIVLVVSAGNSGEVSSGGAGEIGDPGRAQYAITVVASSDINQLTSYSSHGFLAPGDTFSGDDDAKPDLAAPGGSADQSMILSVDSNDSDVEDSTGTFIADQQSNDYHNIQGTSMAAPFVAGGAALVIDAMQQAGAVWHTSGPEALADVLKVKMLLLLTATETNQARETGSASGDPTLDRGGKDIQEGYGMINADAAVEAAAGLTYSGSSLSDTFGANAFDKRCWARVVSLTSGNAVQYSLTVPAGGDFDLYLYSSAPNAYGDPQILASSTNAGAGVAEQINYTPSATGSAYLAVKRVSGSGAWNLGTPSGVEQWQLFEVF